MSGCHTEAACESTIEVHLVSSGGHAYKCITPFEMLRHERARFILGLQA